MQLESRGGGDVREETDFAASQPARQPKSLFFPGATVLCVSIERRTKA